MESVVPRHPAGADGRRHLHRPDSRATTPGAIQDVDGNDAAGFTTGAGGVPAVTNNSTVQPAAPGKVPNVAAEATGETGIALTWDRPDNGGRVIASYRIEWSADGNAPWTELVAAHTEMRAGEIERRYEHTGLDPDTTRHYRVRAKNAIERRRRGRTLRAPPPPPRAARARRRG